MENEEDVFCTWQAGEIAPAGTYARIDVRTNRLIQHTPAGPLPASFDGHVALYRAYIRVTPPARVTVLASEHSPQAVS